MTKPDRDTVRDIQTALRVSREELEEIDRRAAEKNLSRSSYMIAASLGRLDVDIDEILGRLEDLERRQKRLEDLGFE